MLTHNADVDVAHVDTAHIDTPEGLARVLRHLRRRLARHRNDAPLTYRELAARTGWAHGVIGDYFAGKTLPPTDRFDILIDLLGATPAEQRRLATARDQVEELRRSSRTAPAATDAVPDGNEIFMDIARRVAWATLTIVDAANRPRPLVVRPLWEHRADGLTGWVLVRWNEIRTHAANARCVSLSYWHPGHGAAVAQCEAHCADEHERRHVRRLATRPPPHGSDPGTAWPADVDSPGTTLLRLWPYQVMSVANGSG